MHAEPPALCVLSIDGNPDLEGVSVELSDARDGEKVFIRPCRFDHHVIEYDEIGSEGLEFTQWFDAEAVVTQAQFAWKRLDCPAFDRLVKRTEPSPHDSAAVGGENTFRGKKITDRVVVKRLLRTSPVHPTMRFWYELLRVRIPISEIIPAAKGMANAQEHPLVTKAEEIRAGNIFADGHICFVSSQKVTNIGPVPLGQSISRPGG